MTLQEIEVFLSVARTGSVSGAAEQLFISQPAVSRHLNALEGELGCTLFERGRGLRRSGLTEQGRNFLPAAEKLRQAWQEALEAPGGKGETLRAAAVGSLCYDLLPRVFRVFLEEKRGRGLVFHQMSSYQAYESVARGETDLALISDDMYHPQVETVPLFREPMVLLAGADSPLTGCIHPRELDAGKEVRLPWNPEYDLWHSFWFKSGEQARLVVNQMSVLEQAFLWKGDWGDSWAIAPVLVARRIAERTGARICTLEDGPPEEIIYSLQGRKRKPELTGAFLKCLREELSGMPAATLYF